MNIHPGQVLALFYPDDTFYHERYALWRVKDGVWVTCTPDGDIYAEDLRGVPDGPSKVKIKDKDYVYWSRVGGPSYRFAVPPNEEELKSLIRRGLQEAQAEGDFDAEWKPVQVIVNGQARGFDEFFGGSFLTRRLGKKQTATPGLVGPSAGAPSVLADPGVPDIIAQSLLENVRRDVRSLEAAPAGHMWVYLPTLGIDGHGPPTEVVIDPGHGIRTGDRLGLYRGDLGWVPIHLIALEQAPAIFEAHRPKARVDEGDDDGAGPNGRPHRRGEPEQRAPGRESASH